MREAGANLQGHGGAQALRVLVELDADGLAVGQARELVRVHVLEVVGLGRQDDLAGPVDDTKKDKNHTKIHLYSGTYRWTTRTRSSSVLCTGQAARGIKRENAADGIARRGAWDDFFSLERRKGLA